MEDYLLSDLLEVKVPIIATNESHESQEEFCKRRMHVDVVLGLDIFRSELSKVNLVKPTGLC